MHPSRQPSESQEQAESPCAFAAESADYNHISTAVTSFCPSASLSGVLPNHLNDQAANGEPELKVQSHCSLNGPGLSPPSSPIHRNRVEIDLCNALVAATESNVGQYKQDWIYQHANGRTPRPFTVYPDDQGATRDLPLEVEHQRAFTGPYTISASVADIKCSDVGVEGLLDAFNTIMGSSHLLSPSLQLHLNHCISQDYDFGLAYSYLRPHWDSDFATLIERMDEAQSKDAALRQDALDPSATYITNPKLPPRRVWDLYSNRVIPYYWWGGDPYKVFPVSHSWVDETERLDVWTPINEHKWPVQVPNDSSLERVRIELLNYSKEFRYERGYSWLDVLCLQQIGGECGRLGLDLPNAPIITEERSDAVRLEEWKTDVPTIGYIYHRSPRALVYFNGLGRPFHDGGYEDPRHWFSRAWTVQEAVISPRLGGATSSFPELLSQSQRTHLPPSSDLHKGFYERFDKAFLDKKLSKRSNAPSLSRLISNMRKRFATSELDKISGLASLSRPDCLPIYNARQSPDEAWATFVGAMGACSRAHLFFWYPVAGDAGASWMPSWPQAMVPDVPVEESIDGSCGIHYDGAWGLYYGKGFNVLDNCSVLGFGLDSVLKLPERLSVRRGRIIANYSSSSRREQLECEVVADHRLLINEYARYTVIMSRNDWRLPFVVGVRDGAGVIQKLCTLSDSNLGGSGKFRLAAHRDDFYLI